MCWMNSAVRRNRRETCTEWIEELYAEDHGMIMFHHVSRTVVARLEVFFFGAFAAIDANKINFLLTTDFLQSSTSWSARAFLALLAKHLWGYVHDFPTIPPIIQFEHVSNHPALHSNRPRNASPEGGPCQPRRGNSSWIIHGMCKPMLQWCKVRSQDSKSDIHTDGSWYHYYY